jgi:hypothetical protein
MPQGRGQTPEDMEQLAVFLATRANMTGQCVNVDGSMVSHWAAVSSRHGGELAFSKGQAPGLALGLRNAFAALPASSTASTRADEIARRRPIPPIPPTLLNLQGISAVSKKLGSVGGVGGANAAFAVGAPAGTALYAGYGFAAIALTSTLIPLVTLLLVAPLRSIAPPPHAQTRAAFTRIVGIVWVPGLGLALSGVGFGAITPFIVLLFAQHGWGQAWFAFTALSIAFMAGRLIFGHLPDKIGGARVALVCVLIEAVGQALIWLAPSSALALVGVMLTGLGYSLVYPGFGVEAVRHAPPQSRGLAMGAYTAFLDLSLGLASPCAGFGCERSRPGRGVPRQHAGRAVRRGYRSAAPELRRRSKWHAGVKIMSNYIDGKSK